MAVLPEQEVNCLCSKAVNSMHQELRMGWEGVGGGGREGEGGGGGGGGGAGY